MSLPEIGAGAAIIETTATAARTARVTHVTILGVGQSTHVLRSIHPKAVRDHFESTGSATASNGRR